MRTSLKTIGILGGMGPNASADFLQRILHIASRKFGAVQDDDYPPVVLNSVALQGFDVTGITDMPLVERQLVRGVQVLQQAGAQCIAIPCNTVHCLYGQMQSAIDIPILNIADCTAAAVSSFGFTTVGVCGSVTTVQTNLYANACNAYDVQTIVPSPGDQQAVNAVIEAVMSGTYGDEELCLLKSVVLKLQRSGAQGVILGCTELPLVLNQKWTDVPVFDSLEILAQRATEVSYCCKQEQYST